MPSLPTIPAAVALSTARLLSSTFLQTSSSVLKKLPHLTSNFTQYIPTTISSLYNPLVQKPTYSSFITHTPPDITPKTRIIAMCTVNNGRHHDGHGGIFYTDDADPEKSGWLVGDWLAWYQLLSRVGPKSQTWLHCTELEEQIGRYGSYTHGGKVVLDRKLLVEAERGDCEVPLEQVPVGMLKRVFLEKVREECRTASAGGEDADDLLVLVVGHGDFSAGGWVCDYAMGGGEREYEGVVIKEQVTREELMTCLEHTKPGVRVTLVTTNPYGSGWICHPDLTTTTKTTLDTININKGYRLNAFAAFPLQILTTLFSQQIATALASDPDNDDDTDSRSVNPIEISNSNSVSFFSNEQTLRDSLSSAYTAFETAIGIYLTQKLDRRGHAHEVVFSSTGDPWVEFFAPRRGIALSVLRESWDGLEYTRTGEEEEDGEDRYMYKYTAGEWVEVGGYYSEMWKASDEMEHGNGDERGMGLDGITNEMGHRVWVEQSSLQRFVAVLKAQTILSCGGQSGEGLIDLEITPDTDQDYDYDFTTTATPILLQVLSRIQRHNSSLTLAQTYLSLLSLPQPSSSSLSTPAMHDLLRDYYPPMLRAITAYHPILFPPSPPQAGKEPVLDLAAIHYLLLGFWKAEVGWMRMVDGLSGLDGWMQGVVSAIRERVLQGDDGGDVRRRKCRLVEVGGWVVA